MPVILRGCIAIVFVISLVRSTIPEKAIHAFGLSYDWLSHVPTLGYFFCILVLVLCSRFALVGTCCLPSMQLRDSALKAVLDTSDPAMESRFYAKRQQMAQNLSKAITFKTVSYDEDDPVNKIDYNEFKKFHSFLATQYPLFHQHLEKTLVNDYSLVFKWEGTDATQKPYLLTAHQDVVPCPELHRWQVSLLKIPI